MRLNKMEKLFLCYWGYGYGVNSFTSRIVTYQQAIELFDDVVIDWIFKADIQDTTWDFSGPIDEFMIMRVQ
jgi:hypothetical protein